jgi:hypothetical protein
VKRIAIGLLQQETNLLNRVETQRQDYEVYGLAQGSAVVSTNARPAVSAWKIPLVDNSEGRATDRGIQRKLWAQIVASEDRADVASVGLYMVQPWPVDMGPSRACKYATPPSSWSKKPVLAPPRSSTRPPAATRAITKIVLAKSPEDFSTAHTRQDIDQILQVMEESFAELAF